MSVQGEIDRIKKNVNDTLKAIWDTGVTVGTGSDALPAAARALANEKQNKLTGTAGQFVGFDAPGNATPVAAPMPKVHKVTLTTAGWNASAKTQTVTVSGVLADETKQLIMPMPAMASQANYAAAGIACTKQEADALTFQCQTVPTADLTVYVAVQEVTQG